MRFASIYSAFLNLNNVCSGETEAKSLLNLISNLLNLSRISLSFTNSSILSFGAKSLISPLTRLLNLSSVSLNFSGNYIGAIGA